MISATYEQGQWGTIEDKVNDIESFTRVQELEHRGGDLLIYRAVGTKFTFVCLLKIGIAGYRVWVPEMIALIQFLKEIDARPKNALVKYLETTSLESLLGNLHAATDEHFGTLPIRVENWPDIQ